MKRIILLLAALTTALCLSAQPIKPYLSQEAVASSLAVLPPPPEPGSVEFLLDQYC